MDKREEIIKIIKDNPNLSGTSIYNKIKKTKIGIRHVIFYEIYRKTRNIKKQKRSIPSKWTEKEIKVLCKYFPVMKTSLMVKYKVLNRTGIAIDRKANKLGLKKTF